MLSIEKTDYKFLSYIYYKLLSLLPFIFSFSSRYNNNEVFWVWRQFLKQYEYCLEKLRFRFILLGPRVEFELLSSKNLQFSCTFLQEDASSYNFFSQVKQSIYQAL